MKNRLDIARRFHCTEIDLFPPSLYAGIIQIRSTVSSGLQLHSQPDSLKLPFWRFVVFYSIVFKIHDFSTFDNRVFPYQAGQPFLQSVMTDEAGSAANRRVPCAFLPEKKGFFLKIVESTYTNKWDDSGKKGRR